MIKNFLFAVALLSLALSSGCAKGGNCIVTPPVTINVTTPSGVNALAIFPGQSVTLTATPSNGGSMAVNWSLTGAGMLTPVTPATTPPTAIYLAPAMAASGITVTATSTTNSSIAGTLPLTVVLASVVVTPTTVTVGENLAQQFTAVAVPDDASQTFTWTCTPAGSCGTFSCGAGNPTCSTATSDPATYTAPSSAQTGIQVVATSSVQQSPQATGASKVTVVSSRLAPGTYSFRFSGYNNNNPATPVALAGTFILAANGTITAGVEDVAGVSTPYFINSVSY